MHIFTLEGISAGLNQVTQRLSVTALTRYSETSVVEYLESSQSVDDGIAHLFSVDPVNFIHPKLNLQYSLGGTRGMSKKVQYRMMLDNQTRQPAVCKVVKIGCMIFLL